MGRIGQCKERIFHGGPTPPTGYDYIDGRLVINEYEAMQVREALRFLKAKHSFHKIIYEQALHQQVR